LLHGSAPSAPTDSLSPGGSGYGREGGNRRTTHRLKYHRQHLLNIAQPLATPEPQYPKALTSKTVIAPHIPSTVVVLAAIGLHKQPRTEVHEIHHIAAQRLLTAKFLTRQPVAAQVSPKQLFRIGHVAAQLSGEVFLVHFPFPRMIL